MTNIPNDLTTFKKEKNKLREKWAKAIIYSKYPSPEDMSVVLENERLLQEAETPDKQYARLRIPLVMRIFDNLIVAKLASVQPMFGPASLVYHYKNNKIVDQEVIAKTYKMKAVWSLEAAQDLRSAFNIDAESELMAILAQEMSLEFNRMAIHEMVKSAALKKGIDVESVANHFQVSKAEVLKKCIIELGEDSKRLYGRPFPNWMVCSPEVIELLLNVSSMSLKNKDIFTEGLGLSDYGTMELDENSIEVYRDPLMPTTQILLGYKGEDEFDAGYVFSPYVLCGLTPVVLDPEFFVPRRGFMSRFASTVVDPTYYSVLTAMNLAS